MNSPEQAENDVLIDFDDLEEVTHDTKYTVILIAGSIIVVVIMFFLVFLLRNQDSLKFSRRISTFTVTAWSVLLPLLLTAGATAAALLTSVSTVVAFVLLGTAVFLAGFLLLSPWPKFLQFFQPLYGLNERYLVVVISVLLVTSAGGTIAIAADRY